jgi:hypothetical protein
MNCITLCNSHFATVLTLYFNVNQFNYFHLKTFTIKLDLFSSSVTISYFKTASAANL